MLSITNPVLKNPGSPIRLQTGHIKILPKVSKWRPKSGDAIMMLTISSWSNRRGGCQCDSSKIYPNYGRFQKRIRSMDCQALLCCRTKQEASYYTGTFHSLNSIEGNIYSLMGVSDISKFQSLPTCVFKYHAEFSKELKIWKSWTKTRMWLKIKTVHQKCFKSSF